MSLHLEIGLNGYAVLVLKLGPTSNAPSYISLAIPPSHVVVLLAISQLMTILWVSLQAFRRWRTGSRGSNVAISDAVVRGWSFILDTMKQNLINVSVESRDLLQHSTPKREENGGYNAVSPHPHHPTIRVTQPLTANKQQLQSPLLALPGEVRMMIYRYLLLSTNPSDTIYSPNFLVSAKRRGLLIPAGSSRARYHSPNIGNMERSGTHAALLRTCRKVYDEALSVLYSENTFAFHDTDGIEAFMAEGLVTMHGM